MPSVAAVPGRTGPAGFSVRMRPKPFVSTTIASPFSSTTSALMKFMPPRKSATWRLTGRW